MFGEVYIVVRWIRFIQCYAPKVFYPLFLKIPHAFMVCGLSNATHLNCFTRYFKKYRMVVGVPGCRHIHVR